MRRSYRNQRGLHAVVAAALACGASGTGAAQVLLGTLTGNVADATGAVVPGATVKALAPATGFTRQAVTNSEGIYNFTDLQPGTYTVTVTAPSFGTYKQDGVRVEANSAIRVNPVLNTGSVTQEVSVTDAPPALQTDRADTNYNISQQQLQELPTTSTTGRNFQSLYRLVPGSTPPAEQNSAGANPQRAQAVNVNGVSNATNTTRIDGAVDQYPWLPYLVAYVPPQDAIESVNVVTGSFNAEQGSAGGAAINVTLKNGTNQFHGSVFEYNSISKLNARGYFQTAALVPVVPKNIFNQYGLSLGGPIKKDKLFFFVDWESTHQRRTNSGTGSVPSLAVRNGDFSGKSTTIFQPNTGTNGAGKTPFAGNIIPSGSISAAAKTLLANLPAPNIASSNPEANNYFGVTPYSFDRESYDIKLAYNPTDKTSFFGHYSASPSTITDPPQFGSTLVGGTWDGGQPGTATGTLRNIGLSATHTFTPHVLLDANFGFTRQRLGAQAPDLALGNYGTDVLKIPGTNGGSDPLYGGVPAMFFTNSSYLSLGNSNTGSPFLFRDNQYTGNLNTTWVRGTHSFRFGGEYIHYAINHFQPGSGTGTTPRGGFTFNGGATTSSDVNKGVINNYNAFADFLLGQANIVGRGQQITNPLTQRSSSFAFFAQDTWQASNSLTINYGIRYEYYTLPVSDHFGLFRYDPSIRTTVGTANYGTVLVGGRAGIPNNAYINNHWGMIVPRLGISYRATPKTVIRTGFGMTFDPDNLRNLLNAYPANVVLSQSGANSYVPVTSFTTGIPSLPIPNIDAGYVALPTNIATNAVPKDFRRGYIESYNLSIQHELPASLVATVAYVGSHAVRQQSNVNINAAPIPTPSTPGYATQNYNLNRLLNTTYGQGTNNTDINELRPFRGSVYNGLQAQLTRNAARYGSSGLIYTFSKAMDISDNSQATGLSFAYPAYWDRNWALAGYDRKHNLQWWTVVPLPFGKDQGFLKSGVGAAILGGWQLQTVMSYVSGTPFSINANSSTLNAPGNTQFADRNGPLVILGAHAPNHQYVSPASFADPALRLSAGTFDFGNAGRDSVRGPGFFNLDAGVKRTFPIYERINVQLQAESFDITNTPQFANPGTTNINSGGFGQITTSNASRTVRLSGRINF